mmetsp:Transcript_16218/g.49074  ORF Transcript_16218/g.49074 Transcript_16218/m.49074 type:complete len:368 (-) Transcript_16218:1487-2590(-)
MRACLALTTTAVAQLLARLCEHQPLIEAWRRREAVVVRGEELPSLQEDEQDVTVETLAAHVASGGLLVASRSREQGSDEARGDSGWRVESARLRSARDVWALLEEGSTLVVNGAAETVPSVARCAVAAARAFGAPVSVNAYATRGGFAAAPVHSDSQEILAVQASGSQRWAISDDTVFDVGPSDVVYVPAGVPHATEATAGLSFHLTFGVEYRTFELDFPPGTGRALPVGALATDAHCRAAMDGSPLAPLYVRHNRRVLDAQADLYACSSSPLDWANRLSRFADRATRAALDHRRACRRALCDHREVDDDRGVDDDREESCIDDCSLIEQSQVATALYVRRKLEAQGFSDLLRHIDGGDDPLLSLQL